MKFKLDENLGKEVQKIFHESGDDTQSVRDENLQGTSDQNLYNVCCKEKRCIITLDLDFSDVMRFSPKETSGIVVLRFPKNASYAILKKLIEQFFEARKSMLLDGKLWIVELNRIRVHQPEDED